MDEKLLAALALIWSVLSIYHINSFIQQENNELKSTTIKANSSPNSNEITPTQTVLILGGCGFFLWLLLVIRAHKLSTQLNRLNNNIEHQTFFSQESTIQPSDSSTSSEDESKLCFHRSTQKD